MENRSIPNSLSAFVEQQRESSPEWSAQIVNRTDPVTIRTMVEDLFDSLDIDTREMELGGVDDDLFVVMQDGTVVASSPMDTLKETLLMVNADRYNTGTRLVGNIDVPDVILELSDTVFSLNGYPESNTEKLVLTLISRYIEQRALAEQTGTLRTLFQKLSRLNDERGTREFYKQLGQSDGLDTHVYGIPDWKPPTEFGLNCHEVVDDEIRNSWVVVYRPDVGQGVAMVAINTSGNKWDGYWTFDTDEIRAIDRYIMQTF